MRSGRNGQWLAQAEAGKSIREIAREDGCNPSTVLRGIRRARRERRESEAEHVDVATEPSERSPA